MSLRRITSIGILLFVVLIAGRLNAQQSSQSALLWEITGNGLQQPSYLYGTYHSSDKLVMELGESLFDALEQVETVAIELEDSLWIEDYMQLNVVQNYWSLVNDKSLVSALEANKRCTPLSSISVDPTFEIVVSHALRTLPEYITYFQSKHEVQTQFRYSVCSEAYGIGLGNGFYRGQK